MVHFSLRLAAFLFPAISIVLLPPQPLARLTQAELKSEVQRAIQSNPSSVVKSQFWIDPQCLYYRVGYRIPSGDARKPIDIPTDTQYKVELLRQWRWWP